MSRRSPLVSLEEVGEIGLVRIANPPVNALNQEVRTGLAEAIESARNNPRLKIVLIASAGQLFSAGADINEFDRPLGEPELQTVEAAIESSAIPGVVAINGLCLGGALELAMACHYRLAHKNAKLGLPEINLGIIPGAGGTQRLPRLAGASRALDLILSGAPVSASQAKSIGLVDEVAEGDLLEAAQDYCQQLLVNRAGPRPACDRTVLTGLDDATVAEALRKHARSLKGRTTQTLVIEAIRAATLPFAEGLAVEADLSQRSLTTRESRALRHVFFAERAAGKLDGTSEPARQPEINRVAIIGAGTMGNGIAMAFADAGRKVLLIDNAQSALTRSEEFIRSAYASSVKRGRIDQKIAEERAARITRSTALAGAAEADLAIEAVFEDMNLKKEVLASLDAFLPAERPLATNTSTLSVTELGRATQHPERVLGLHFFSPANATRLLEIVRGDDTSRQSLETAFQVAKLLKKVPAVSRDAFGFIGNRMMLDGYFREAELLLLEGASPAQVDAALEQFGFAMGPQRVSDLAGNDVGTKAREELYKRATRPDPYFVIADRLTKLGRLGQKTGRGFYRYEAGAREALPDPEVAGMIEALAAERGIARREIGEEEIVERCLLTLINVGAQVLDEGVAARAADIDVVWTSGYGFPRHFGGPMFYADELGLGRVIERIHHYHGKLGHYWRPAALIDRLADAKSSFGARDRQEASRAK
ncbi:MAG TPA: 3-hydroxyacyl-CoA dehydrogenase NAD-binding domain-containing protein [Bryobacteraceae bacterium]|nr:3-hydroxyacyl-CoA dehydrogenase NAD-binding domain-containing protein [Bryobacteraceae bacterium]